MKPDCKYFREYEEAAYVRGYKDGLAKVTPAVSLPEKSHKIEDSHFLTLLEVATPKGGATAQQMLEALKISRGTFYSRMKDLIFQKKALKNDKARPVLYLINRNPDKTIPLI